MMTLNEIALKHRADKGSNYHDYCKRYEPLLSGVRQDPITIAEIGVQFGASILMWLEYFPNATVVGIDQLHEFHSENPRYHFRHGDQRDAAFLRDAASKEGRFFMVVDDGCHCADAMKISFETLWPFVQPGGFYAIEDIFTLWHPFWMNQSNGVDGKLFLSSLLDDVQLHGKSFHGRPEPSGLELTPMEASIDSIQISTGLCIIRKKL